MSKKIYVKDAPEIELEFKDGKKYVATFNMKSFMYFQEMIEKYGMENLSVVHMCAIILYAGIKVNQNEFTEEEANKIVFHLPLDNVNDIISEFTDEMDAALPEKQKEIQKKMMAHYLKNLAKKQ